MIIRKAGLEDIDLLIKLRMDFLSEDGNMTREEQETVGGKLRIYLQKHMPDDSFIAYIAEDSGDILSAAFMSIVERPPRIAIGSYLVGTVYNVFTYPGSRRKGAATKVMAALLDEAKALDVVAVDLMASEDGKYLYEKLGFDCPEKYTFMRKKL